MNSGIPLIFGIVKMKSALCIIAEGLRMLTGNQAGFAGIATFFWPTASGIFADKEF